MPRRRRPPQPVGLLDPAPLIEFARMNAALPEPGRGVRGVIGIPQIADYLGVDRDRASRWASGQVRIRSLTADRICVALGRHPGEIFPEWFDFNEAA